MKLLVRFQQQSIFIVISLINNNNPTQKLDCSSMLPISKSNLFLNRNLIIIKFNASKMANFASKPKHGPSTDMWEYGEEKTPNRIKISAWNVNGIRSVVNKGSLQKYVRQSDPDIICINQTKICLQSYKKSYKLIAKPFESACAIKQQLNDKKLGNYYQFWNFCKVSSGYSGVLTLSKFKPIRAIQDFKMDHHMSMQGRCLTLQYDKFFVLNCYKPNSGAELQRLQQRTEIYDAKFADHVKELKKTKPVLVCGDMNVAHNEIDIARPKTNTNTAGFTRQERESFSKLLSDCELADSYRYFNPNKVEYTWWSTRTGARQKNIGWRIDYILSSNLKILRSAEIKGRVMGSDHCPVECVIQF